MFVILAVLEIIGIGTLTAEVWTGIAVTGWQGEKPYVERSQQPVHYWTIIVIHLLLGVGLPALGIVLQF